MIFHYSLSHDGHGTVEEREAIFALEDRPEALIEAQYVGKLDGNEVGGGEAIIYTLEGLLYEVAKSHPANYNRAKAAPIQDGKVRPFPQWTLNDLLNCSRELGLLGEDVTKFGHAVREFRNFIHPQQQVAENFRPRKVTAQVARQVLRAAINDLGTQRLRTDR